MSQSTKFQRLPYQQLISPFPVIHWGQVKPLWLSQGYLNESSAIEILAGHRDSTLE
ncbi:hypothetical protein [Lyngbya aestuarii]|uniref:hypothetical protein n=1 Tax=Lyngbya aestuarii TaxID=118322 RepID=UPI00403DB0D3